MTFHVLTWLAVLMAATATEVSAAWEYPGSRAEIFDLGAYLMESDPEGVASCPDALGGLLVAAYDTLSSPGQIRISRLAPDGTELWGQAGKTVPHAIGSVGQHSPVAVAPDGTGGAYVAYLCRWPGYDLFQLTHFTAAGGFDRTVPIDNPGTIGDYRHLSIKLVAVAGGDVIAAWTQRSPVAKLHAGRFDTIGTLLWHTDVNQSYRHRETVTTSTRTSWCATSDMLDGILVTWLRHPSGTPEIGAQRIGPDGAVWWGDDGHLLWSGYTLDFHDPVIVGDVLGGGFVVMSHQGKARAQHLDPWGTEMWPAGGILVQDSATPYWAQSTEPALCEDGAFGFIVVHGNEDLFAQRVDYWGSLLWGAGVGIGQRAGQQNRPAIVPDGSQGAVLAWQDLYYGIPGQEWHVLVGMRIDGSGNAVWGPSDVYSAWTVYDPHDVELVASTGGSALCAFACFDLDEYCDDVWALGLPPAGGTGVEPVAEVRPAVRLAVYPNPFPASIRIVVDLPAPGTTRLTIHDVGGRLVRMIEDDLVGPGRRFATWDGRDSAGRLVGNGTYLVRLTGPAGSVTSKVMCLR